MSVAPEFRAGWEVARRVGARESRAEEEVERALARLEALDPALGALEHRLEESALERARALDRRLRSARAAPPLAGVPIVIKANMCLEGAPTTCGSRLLADYRAPYTAAFLERVLAAGAIPVGIARMDEFAMGSSGEHSALGPTRNPWSLARAPGGSSSGSAAAVAAGLVPLALGSDTGGSVRQPAALCGIAGHKPTYGAIPRHGLVAFGSSLDQVAPLARDVRDLELALEVLAGPDPRDPTGVAIRGAATNGARDERAPSATTDTETLAGLRVGIVEEFSREHLGAALEAGVDERVRASLAAFEAHGAELVSLSLPGARHALAAYYVIAAAEASSNLARFDGVRYGARVGGDGSLDGMISATRTRGLGDEVKRRILLGTFVLSAGYRDRWYGRARAVRETLRAEFRRAFERVDVIACATSPSTAFPLGERRTDPLTMYAADVLTVPASLAGLPAVSVPCGTTRSGKHQGSGESAAAALELPVGLQLIAAPRDDVRLLRVARAHQDSLTKGRLTPPHPWRP